MVGWLFLPHIFLKLPGLPDYGKLPATSLGTLLAVLIYDSGRLLSFRPRWPDACWIAWVLCPIASSLSNNLGLYDGLAESWAQFMSWGAPILLGRIYFGASDSLRELALSVVYGAMVYAPLALLETKIGPVLNLRLYGFQASSFMHAARYGGWRPQVFMQTGLALAVWMAAAAFIAFWFWRSGSRGRVFGLPMAVCAPTLMFMTFVCKSGSGLIVLLLGVVSYYSLKLLRTKLPMLLLLVTPALYIATRAAEVLPAETITTTVALVDADRAASLGQRLRQEELFGRHSMIRPLFGWGGWMRGWPRDEEGELIVKVIDGAWTIHISTKGVFGVTAFLATLAIGPWLLFSKVPLRQWMLEQNVAAVALATLVMLYGLDNLMNNMLQPIYELAIGGLISYALAWKPAPRGQRVVLPQVATPTPPHGEPVAV
ncbi:hypothetical protein [Pseudobythopirellula maris]|uniref:hypothetical protein n=1 Tax=Pseudobythopirellula maris TaxID=2527991 RepID=UPI0018D3896F|nr:hypothetical protein [Pseudobythopirellula maris]